MDAAEKIEFSEQELGLFGALAKSAKTNRDDFFTVTSLFWMFYYVEKSLKEVVLHYAQARIVRNEGDDTVINAVSSLFEDCLDEMTLNSKIRIFDKAMHDWAKERGKNASSDIKKLCGFLADMNHARNAIAHNRLSNLKYRGKSLTDLSVFLQMFKDYTSTLVAFTSKMTT